MDSAKDYDQEREDFYEDEYGDDNYGDSDYGDDDYDRDADYEDPYEDYETPWRMSLSEFAASRAMARVDIDPFDPGWVGNLRRNQLASLFSARR